MSDGIRVVLVTAPDAATADTLARGLVERRLAACVNVVPGVVSHYYWDGALQKDAEVLLVVKTRHARFPELTRWIRENHPAELPEIIALPVEGGDERYLRWVTEST